MTADLFSQINGVEVAAHYPNSPGFKVNGTSQESAQNQTDTKETQKLILKVLESGDFTSDEIADKLGKSILYVRPRVSELKALGKIKRAGFRRTNSSGQSANVLTLSSLGIRGEITNHREGQKP